MASVCPANQATNQLETFAATTQDRVGRERCPLHGRWELLTERWDLCQGTLFNDLANNVSREIESGQRR